jgi:protein associated with RNAse G/E
MTHRLPRIFYRKEKLRGACWEYQIEGGWINVSCAEGERALLRHRFAFYRAREVDVRTPDGIVRMHRTGAEQWFFPDRWFSLLRFLTEDDRTVGYYVNFSRPLAELRANYYRDLDLELDLWVEPDGTVTELDRDEFDAEVASSRLPAEWASEVDAACQAVASAVADTVARLGPDIERDRDPVVGLPRFILRV